MEGPSSPWSPGRRVAFLGLCLLLFLTAGATPVHYCDKQADYAVKVKGVQINPNPVVRGKPAKFSISASTGDSISGGKLIIDVKYFGVHIHQESHDLCNETSCPVSGGDFVISHNEALPAFTPPGSYTLNMKMLGEGGSQLTCISFEFKIRVGSPVDDS
uniref:Putative phosphatidylglycerol/phosphatidylinositol transfer protein DDB_G0282179 n=1 Tax=Anthurium amnicola TaxID=1678845 RepID=A0A1D1Y5X8_9ARAE